MNRLFDGGVLIICVVVAVSAAGGLIYYKATEEPDSIYEEYAEEVIEHHTGVDVDLSPDEGEEQGEIVRKIDWEYIKEKFK